MLKEVKRASCSGVDIVYEHYMNKATARAVFKKSCQRRGWNFDDFTETYICKYKYNIRKYSYTHKNYNPNMTRKEYKKFLSDMIIGYEFNGELVMKRCSKCGKLKEVASFGKNSNEKSGINCSCKECCVNSVRESNKLKNNTKKENDMKGIKVGDVVKNQYGTEIKVLEETMGYTKYSHVGFDGATYTGSTKMYLGCVVTRNDKRIAGLGYIGYGKYGEESVKNKSYIVWRTIVTEAKRRGGVVKDDILGKCRFPNEFYSYNKFMEMMNFDSPEDISMAVARRQMIDMVNRSNSAKQFLIDNDAHEQTLIEALVEYTSKNLKDGMLAKERLDNANRTIKSRNVTIRNMKKKIDDYVISEKATDATILKLRNENEKLKKQLKDIKNALGI